MEFAEIVMSRYATKKFDGRKIPETRINELLEMVRFAPSALNLQPWKIKVVTDQNVKEQLKPAAFNQEQVTSCSHLFVFCADPDYESLIRRLGALLQKSGVPEEMQKMIIGMAVQFTQNMSKDQKLAWSQAQTYLQNHSVLIPVLWGGSTRQSLFGSLRSPRPLFPQCSARWGTQLTSRCKKYDLHERRSCSEPGTVSSPGTSSKLQCRNNRYYPECRDRDMTYRC